MSDQREDVSDSSETTDEIEIGDEYKLEPTQHKGPDPEEWGDPEERLMADFEAGKFTEADIINAMMQEKQEAGEDPIVELPDGRVIKGPDPAKWSEPDADEE